MSSSSRSGGPITRGMAAAEAAAKPTRAVTRSMTASASGSDDMLDKRKETVEEEDKREIEESLKAQSLVGLLQIPIRGRKRPLYEELGVSNVKVSKIPSVLQIPSRKGDEDVDSYQKSVISRILGNCLDLEYCHDFKGVEGSVGFNVDLKDVTKDKKKGELLRKPYIEYVRNNVVREGGKKHSQNEYQMYIKSILPVGGVSVHGTDAGSLSIDLDRLGDKIYSEEVVKQRFMADGGEGFSSGETQTFRNTGLNCGNLLVFSYIIRRLSRSRKGIVNERIVSMTYKFGSLMLMRVGILKDTSVEGLNGAIEEFKSKLPIKPEDVEKRRLLDSVIRDIESLKAIEELSKKERSGKLKEGFVNTVFKFAESDVRGVATARDALAAAASSSGRSSGISGGVSVSTQSGRSSGISGVAEGVGEKFTKKEIIEELKKRNIDGYNSLNVILRDALTIKPDCITIIVDRESISVKSVVGLCNYLTNRKDDMGAVLLGSMRKYSGRSKVREAVFSGRAKEYTKMLCQFIKISSDILLHLDCIVHMFAIARAGVPVFGVCSGVDITHNTLLSYPIVGIKESLWLSGMRERRPKSYIKTTAASVELMPEVYTTSSSYESWGVHPYYYGDLVKYECYLNNGKTDGFETLNDFSNIVNKVMEDKRKEEEPGRLKRARYSIERLSEGDSEYIYEGDETDTEMDSVYGSPEGKRINSRSVYEDEDEGESYVASASSSNPSVSRNRKTRKKNKKATRKTRRRKLTRK